MRIRYTPQAFSDRERIFEYLRERSASGARNVALSIREAVAQIKDHPHSGYRTDDPDIRVIFSHARAFSVPMESERGSRFLI